MVNMMFYWHYMPVFSKNTLLNLWSFRQGKLIVLAFIEARPKKKFNLIFGVTLHYNADL